MVTKKSIWILVSLTIIGFILYALIGERYLYSRSFASEVYKYPLPPKTKVVNKDFDYGVFLWTRTMVKWRETNSCSIYGN